MAADLLLWLLPVPQVLGLSDIQGPEDVSSLQRSSTIRGLNEGKPICFSFPMSGLGTQVMCPVLVKGIGLSCAGRGDRGFQGFRASSEVGIPRVLAPRSHVAGFGRAALVAIGSVLVRAER